MKKKEVLFFLFTGGRLISEKGKIENKNGNSRKRAFSFSFG